MTNLKYSRKTKGNKIKIRKITKSGIYLWGTLGICLLISIFKLATMDTGKVNMNNAFREFLKNMEMMFLQPALSDNYTLSEIFQSLGTTFSLAVLTTLIGAFTALFLSFFAAENLSGRKISKIIRILVSFVRAIPTILWVMVFSVVAGIGVEAAVTGICFHSTAYLVKAYSESIEEIDSGIIEALKSTGASFWQTVFQGVLPASITSILSWTFVRLEINFTNAIVVGAAAGAGGIGYEMFMAGRMYFNSREIGFFVYLIFGVALILESISIYLKRKYIVKSL